MLGNKAKAKMAVTNNNQSTSLHCSSSRTEMTRSRRNSKSNNQFGELSFQKGFKQGRKVARLSVKKGITSLESCLFTEFLNGEEGYKALSKKRYNQFKELSFHGIFKRGGRWERTTCELTTPQILQQVINEKVSYKEFTFITIFCFLKALKPRLSECHIY